MSFLYLLNHFTINKYRLTKKILFIHKLWEFYTQNKDFESAKLELLLSSTSTLDLAKIQRTVFRKEMFVVPIKNIVQIIKTIKLVNYKILAKCLCRKLETRM